MKKPLAKGLRDIAIGVTDLEVAEQFYTNTWNLSLVARTDDAVYLRGTGSAHHILALHRSARPEVRMVTFDAESPEILVAVIENALKHGGELIAPKHAVKEPGGGTAVIIRDPQQRVLRFVYGADQHTNIAPAKDCPVKITHVVCNSADVSAAQKFYEEALGFTLSDRTKIMAFMRCCNDHHSIALADASDNTLNHIAFLMPDLESVMRGAGRMRDAGYSIEWGIGRHGPGNNVFSYFIGPSDFVIEYTAEVEQVDDSYVAGGPEDWKWPPGRVDQWGVSSPPSDRVKEAQKKIRFSDAPPL